MGTSRCHEGIPCSGMSPGNNLPDILYLLFSVYFVPAIACGFVKPLSALSSTAGHPPNFSINPVLVDLDSQVQALI